MVVRLSYFSLLLSTSIRSNIEMNTLADLVENVSKPMLTKMAIRVMSLPLYVLTSAFIVVMMYLNHRNGIKLNNL